MEHLADGNNLAEAVNNSTVPCHGSSSSRATRGETRPGIVKKRSVDRMWRKVLRNLHAKSTTLTQLNEKVNSLLYFNADELGCCPECYDENDGILKLNCKHHNNNSMDNDITEDDASAVSELTHEKPMSKEVRRKRNKVSAKWSHRRKKVYAVLLHKRFIEQETKIEQLQSQIDEMKKNSNNNHNHNHNKNNNSNNNNNNNSLDLSNDNVEENLPFDLIPTSSVTIGDHTPDVQRRTLEKIPDDHHLPSSKASLSDDSDFFNSLSSLPNDPNNFPSTSYPFQDTANVHGNKPNIPWSDVPL